MCQPAIPFHHVAAGRVIAASWILLLAVLVTLASPTQAAGVSEDSTEIAQMRIRIDETRPGELGLEIDLHRWPRESSRGNRRHS